MESITAMVTHATPQIWWGDQLSAELYERADRQAVRRFLSYSRTDETWVVRLKSALVERGFQVWVDRDDIQAGERFVRATESAMKTSALWRWWRAPGEPPHRES
jgi:hypothetical protein